MKRWETFRARFEPVRRDDLKPGVSEWIGWEGEWQAAWLIDEEDGGSYVGEYACTISPSQSVRFMRDRVDMPFAWVPERDLVRLETT